MNEGVKVVNSIASIDKYHEFLTELIKVQFKEGRYSKFWELLKDEYSSNSKSIFVLQSQASNSSIVSSAADSNRSYFFDAVEVKVTAPIVVEQDDDIFGDMM